MPIWIDSNLSLVMLAMIGASLPSPASMNAAAVHLPTASQPASQPSLTLVSPNGGQTFHAGDPVTVRWTMQDVRSAVRVRLYRSGQANPSQGFKLPPDGTLRQDVTLCPYLEAGQDYYFAVESSDGSTSISDSSDATFSIVGGAPPPVLTVTSPTAGEVWTTGSRQKVKWTGGAPSGTVSAQLYRGNQSVNPRVVAPAAAGELDWDVCAWETGDDYRILLTLSDCNQHWAFSSEAFTIVPGQDAPPVLTLISPNGGEVIEGGTEQAVIWTAANPRGRVSIHLERGDVSIPLGWAPMDTGRYDWSVCPAGVSGENYRIRIRHEQCPWIVEDVSDSPFSIVGLAPEPTLTPLAPIWGEPVQAGGVTTIRWKAENPAGDVVFILLRSGLPQMTLGEVPMADETFTWEVCPWLETGSEYVVYIGMQHCEGQGIGAYGSGFTIAASGLPTADFDTDCDVDADDVAIFAACATGPDVVYDLFALPPGCRLFPYDHHLMADLDRDGDVDQEDFGILQRSLTEPPPG